MFKPMLPILKAITFFVAAASSIAGHAAILNDSSERRIQVRQGHSNNQVYVQPSNSANRVISSDNSVLRGDSMQGLITQKQREYDFDAKLSIEENKSVNVRKPSDNTIYRSDTYSSTNNNLSRYNTANNTYSNSTYYSRPDLSFNAWLNSNSYRAQEVASYQNYLSSQIGAQNVPPLNELLTTARSWDKCGYEPYQLPPRELWSNMVPTLRLYSQLKQQGILPPSSQIRSAYRSPSLNACAGGARNSKHMNASAIDIWVPEYDNNIWLLSDLHDGLCQFWQLQGQAYSFGLGLYSTGAIHLDTQGYRKWGFSHATSSSCRY